MADIEKLTIKIEANTKSALESIAQLKKNIQQVAKIDANSQGLKVLEDSIGAITKKVSVLQTDIQNAVNPPKFDNKNTSLGDGIAESLGSLKKLNESKTGGILKTGVNMFKGLLKYGKHYIIRQLIMTAITLAKQGMDNLYAYSKQIGGTFSQTLDDLKSSVTFLVNSLGNMFAPLIQVLAPILTTIMDLVGEVANQVGVLLQSLLGMAEITSVTKSVEEYNSAVNKATTMGIDELNTKSNSSSVFSMFKSLTDSTGEYAGVVKILKDALESVTNLLRQVLQLVEPIAVLLGNILEPIYKLVEQPLSDLFEALTIALTPIISLVSDLLYIISDLSDVAFTFLGSFTEDLISLDGLVDNIQNCVNVFNDFYNAIKMTFGLLTGESLENVGDAWSNVFKKILDVGIGAINVLINGLNKLGSFTIKGFSLFGKQFWDDTIVKLWDIPTIPMLANGGELNNGQMFIANEQGAELVGSFDGKTGVMNNQQIVEAVSNGVYSAVLSAMNNTNGNGNTQMNIYLDGKSIGEAVDKYNRNKGIGQSLFKGGIANAN